MKQFVFESRQKTIFIGMMVLGLLCMGITYFTDDHYHTRFWTNFLHNSVFFTGISFVATFIIAVKITAYSGWHTVVKRLWEAISLFQLAGIVLMGIICLGIWLGYHKLYEWAIPELAKDDKILIGKSGFLNPVWYSIATFGILGVWYFFATKFRKLSLEQDKSDVDETYPLYTKMKVWGAAFLPIAGFSSAAVVWLWIMSVDPHWYSTLFAWYNGASWMVSMVAITIMLTIYLKSNGYLEQVTIEHLHDLGKYLFGFSVFWTYLWFSQYMLIWYANIGEETTYYRLRVRDYPWLFYANLFMNFFVPFLILIRNDTKRKFGSLFFVSAVVLLGHWLDFFMMTKFGPLKTSQHLAHLSQSAEEAGHHAATTWQAGFSMPGLLEIGTLAGFAGLFLYLVFSQLTKASLVPQNDPYIAESLNHHVI
jgi:hypothetical protein